jgi:hypothetical protein
MSKLLLAVPLTLGGGLFAVHKAGLDKGAIETTLRPWIAELKTKLDELKSKSTTGGKAGDSPASSPVEPESAGFDLEVKELYSFKDGTAHCPDREMKHPCTTELRVYLEEGGDAKAADRAFECTSLVYETMAHDYNIVKNMTHLLLDLDASEHKFAVNDRFWNLGMDFGKKLILHDGCMSEFDSKGMLECRCPLLYSKILMYKWKNADRLPEAKAWYEHVRALSWEGDVYQYPPGEAFPWPDFRQLPQTYIPGLYASPFWPKEKALAELPVVKAMEDNFEMINREIATLYEDGKVHDPAYRFLFKKGKWDQVLLYNGRKWDPKYCKLMPDTCALMKEVIMKEPGYHMPWMSSQNMQVVVLRITPGTEMETHCGPSNSVLNVHLGVSGLEGAELLVGGEIRGWDKGKVLVFDGSYDHSVRCEGCKEDRVIMMVRHMHPDVTKDTFRNVGNKTAFEDIPSDFWDDDFRWPEVPQEEEELPEEDLPAEIPAEDSPAEADGDL